MNNDGAKEIGNMWLMSQISMASQDDVKSDTLKKKKKKNQMSRIDKIKLFTKVCKC